MKNAFTPLSTVCAAALMCASAAHADVTAADVWDNWQGNLALYGEDGASFDNVTTEDGQVTVSGLVLTLDDGESVVKTSIGDLTFTELGDGTVSVTMQETYMMSVDVVADNSGFDVAMTQDNLSITVSGVPEAMNYDVTADSYEIRVVDFRGEAASTEGDVVATARDIAGSYQTDLSNGTETTFDFAASGMDLLVDVKEPETEGYAVFSGKLDALTTSGVIALPEGADIDVPETFAGNFTFAGESNFGSANFVFDVAMDGSAATGSLSAAAGTFGGSATPADLSYNIAFADVAVTTQSPDMPVPVAVSFRGISNDFFMPVAATDDPAPFGYSIALTDFVVNDEIWALGDPAGAIPRDPASFVFDISGMAKLFFDLLDPAQEEALAFADVPGEVLSLAVNTIRLTAAGAEITASGDFTFDNTDLETFAGMPRPEGVLNVGITGANALIDTLVGMGLLPEQQATMGRMMMGMFTQPAGDDALTSKIEINEQGHILANGQRIQ